MNVFQKSALALFIGCIGCGNTHTLSVDDNSLLLSCNVSSKNDERAISGSEYFGGKIMSIAGRDDSIRQDTLAFLLEEVRTNSQCLVIKMCVGQNQVFYVAHSGQPGPPIKIRLQGEGLVKINGKAHTEPLSLPPGAHGFQVISQDTPILVDHVFAPIR